MTGEPRTREAETLTTAPGTQHLIVRTVSAAGTATVIVSGELDIFTLPAVRQALAEVLAREPERLVLDLAGITFIDCASARVLAAAAPVLPGLGEAILRRPSRVVLRVLELTGMSACFRIERSLPHRRPARSPGHQGGTRCASPR